MPSTLLELAGSLSPKHRAILEWFDRNAGQVTGWPGRLPDGSYLATKAKGIYKPEGMKYAVSVRQSLTGPYPDRPVSSNADGTWTFEYFQEKLDPRERDAVFTNRGLMNCLCDVVPVGVFVQLSGKPTPRYRVLGLALVAGYGDGYFSLQGFDALREAPSADREVVIPRQPQRRADYVATLFDPRMVEDERRRVFTEITRRQGQPGFRRVLLSAYERRCAVTAYEAVDALEAAHIVPYRGPVTNHPSNGLLLRADLHSLFDLGQIGVEPDEGVLVVGKDIRDTRYRVLHGQKLRLPDDPAMRPSTEALRQQLSEVNL